MHRSEQSGKRSAWVISTLGYKGLLQLPPRVSEQRYVSNLCSSNVMLPTRALPRLRNAGQSQDDLDRCSNGVIALRLETEVGDYGRDPLSDFHEAFQSNFMPWVQRRVENFRKFVPQFEWPNGGDFETRDPTVRPESQDSHFSPSLVDDGHAVVRGSNAPNDSPGLKMSGPSHAHTSISSAPEANDDSPYMGFPGAETDLTSDFSDGSATPKPSINMFPHCDGPMSTEEDDLNDKSSVDEFGNLNLFPSTNDGSMREIPTTK